jgi:hypothetical protein
MGEGWTIVLDVGKTFSKGTLWGRGWRLRPAQRAARGVSA